MFFNILSLKFVGDVSKNIISLKGKTSSSIFNNLIYLRSRCLPLILKSFLWFCLWGRSGFISQCFDFWPSSEHRSSPLFFMIWTSNRNKKGNPLQFLFFPSHSHQVLSRVYRKCWTWVQSVVRCSRVQPRTNSALFDCPMLPHSKISMNQCKDHAGCCIWWSCTTFQRLGLRLVWEPSTMKQTSSPCCRRSP